MKKLCFSFLVFFFLSQGYSQKTEIGVSFGRFYAIYKSKDDGNGFRNLPGTQYNSFPTISISTQVYKKIFLEGAISYLPYPQYTGTRLYSPGFYSTIHSGNIAATLSYSALQSNTSILRLRAGLGVGIIPDQYTGGFSEIFIQPGGGVDSISRGTIKRDFGALFPTVCFGMEYYYRLSKRLSLGVNLSYQHSFSRITEYDIYYNDGTGLNDQHAIQWGNGSFYGLQLGIKYRIKDSD